MLKRSTKNYKKHISDIEITSPESLSLALENIAECVSITDDNNIIFYVNKAFLNTYGYDREEIIGRSIGVLRSDKYDEKTDFILEKTREGHWQGELTNKRKDGTEFPVFVSTSSIKRPDGTLIGHIGVAVDATEQKKNQEHYRVLVDYSLQGLLIIQHGKIAFANPKAVEIFGYSLEELLNFEEADVLNIFHPLDRKTIAEIERKFKSGNVESFMSEIRILTANHELKWVQLFSMKTSYRSKEAIQYAFIDISEKKSAEHGYLKVSEQIKKQNLALHEWVKYDTDDLQGSLKRLTRMVAETMDIDRVGIWLFNQQQDALECIELYDRKSNQHQKGFLIALKSGKFLVDQFIISRSISIPNLTADSNIQGFSDYFIKDQIVSVIASRIGYGSDFQGIVSGENCGEIKYWSDEDSVFLNNIADIVSFLREFDKRNMIEKELRDSESRLKEMVLTKDTFFSIIAHDLKNPFHAIVGFSELLKNDYDSYSDEEKKAFISKIFEASENTYKLLQNLLEWANIQTGKIAIRPENLDLSTLVNDTLLLLKPQADEKQLSLISEVGYMTEIYADENMVNAILRNLVSNAIHYSKPGGKISIVAKQVKSNLDIHYQVKVMDQGVGIAPENIQKLFKIEEKFRTKGTSGEQGSGVGLILSKDFIELCGGRIWVESEQHKGTTFAFTLPVARKETSP